MSKDWKFPRGCGYTCPYRDSINGRCSRHGPTVMDEAIRGAVDGFRDDVKRIVSTPTSQPPAAETRPWYETDAHRDLSRIIPDMEGKIAEAKVKFGHCLPDHLFAPLEASITELKVLRHELAALTQPEPTAQQEGEEKPVMVPRYATDRMMQAGLYHMPDGVEYADLFTAWHAMFDCLMEDGGCTTSLPAALSSQQAAGEAEAVKEQPVAWMYETKWNSPYVTVTRRPEWRDKGFVETPLYATPQPTETAPGYHRRAPDRAQPTETQRIVALRVIADADPGASSEQSLAHEMAAIAKQALGGEHLAGEGQ